MPHTIPTDRIIPIALNYLIRRQVQARVSTLRQLSKRMGLGAEVLLGKLERVEGLEYVLMRHGSQGHAQTEVVLLQVPPEYLTETGVSLAELQSQIPLSLTGAQFIEDPHRLNAVDEVDPYVRYRITDQQFEILQPHLIGIRELVTEARSKGYSVTAINKAVGGDRMRYVPVGPLWRPYVYRNKRYYLRDILRFLDQSDGTYNSASTLRRRRTFRQPVG